MSNTVHVIYTGNADPSVRTGELQLDVDRGNLVLGGEPKELTVEELHNFQRFGVQLQVVNADGSPLAESLTVDELKLALDGLGETYKASASKDQLVKQLESVQAKNQAAAEETSQGSDQTTSTGSTTNQTGTTV